MVRDRRGGGSAGRPGRFDVVVGWLRNWRALALNGALIGAYLLLWGALCWMGWSVVAGIRSSDWRSTRMVEAVSAGVVVGRRRTTHTPTVRYRYVVEGRAYENDRVMFGLPIVSAQRAAGIVADSKAGRQPVYYDPTDPGDAVLVKGGPPNPMPWISLPLALLATAHVCHLVGGGLRTRRGRR